MANLSQAEPYIGKYFSQDYLRREILRQTDDEIVEQDKLIAAEIEAGLYVDPVAMQQLEVTAAATDVAAQQSDITEPDTEKDSQTVEAPEGGEI